MFIGGLATASKIREFILGPLESANPAEEITLLASAYFITCVGATGAVPRSETGKIKDVDERFVRPLP